MNNLSVLASVLIECYLRTQKGKMDRHRFLKQMLLFTALLCGTSLTIRLVYPQWQGGDIAHWITEVKDPEQASRGYYLGAQLLNFLAPDNGQETYTVPVATDKIERKVTDGVLDKEALIAQTRAALDILKITHPDKIVTLGGECSASVVPFTYLADKYKDDVAMVWIDAHPDITLPGDVYAGYHAMAVTACMGLGDKQLVSELPMKIDPSKILFIGLCDWERDEIKARQEQYGIQHLNGCNRAEHPRLSFTLIWMYSTRRKSLRRSVWSRVE